jgi:hypothetical protein
LPVWRSLPAAYREVSVSRVVEQRGRLEPPGNVHSTATPRCRPATDLLQIQTGNDRNQPEKTILERILPRAANPLTLRYFGAVT